MPTPWIAPPGAPRTRTLTQHGRRWVAPVVVGLAGVLIAAVLPNPSLAAASEPAAKAVSAAEENQRAFDAAGRLVDVEGMSPGFDETEPLFGTDRVDVPSTVVDASDSVLGPVPAERPALTERVEEVSMRSEFSRTWRNPDGTYTTESFTDPIYVRDGSELVAVDRTLGDSGVGERAGRDGERFHAPRAMGKPSIASSADDSRLVEVTTPDGETVAYGLEGAVAVPGRAVASRVSFGGALDGTDIELDVVSRGVKETLVLDGPEAVRPWVFNLVTEGLTARLVPTGGVVFYDGLNQPRVEIPPGFAVDAGGVRTDAVRYELSDDASRLTVTLDAAWAADPARVWPVRLDPSVTNLSTSDDTFTSSCAPTTSYASSDQLQIGSFYNCTNRSFVQFQNFAYWHLKAKVLSASLKLWNNYTTTACPQYPVYAFDMATPWAGSTFTGSSPFSWYPDGVASAPAGFGGATCPNGGEVSFDVTNSVQRWLDGTRPNAGFVISASADPNVSVGADNFKIFSSVEGAAPPTLVFTWSPYRATYTGTFASVPTSTADGVFNLTATNHGINTWQSSGPNPVYGGFHIFDSAGNYLTTSPVRAALASPIGPGETKTVAIAVPKLTPGSYRLGFELVAEPGIWFHGEGSPRWVVGLNVANQSPDITNIAPVGAADTSSPTFSVVASDPDAWPAGGLTATFRACRDAEMSTGCVTSTATSGTWTPTL